MTPLLLVLGVAGGALLFFAALSRLRPIWRLVALAAVVAVGFAVTRPPTPPDPGSLGCAAGDAPFGTRPTAIGQPSMVRIGTRWADAIHPVGSTASGEFVDVAVIDRVAVAVGRSAAEPTALVVVSADGRSWQRVGQAEPSFAMGDIVDLDAGLGGLIAVGSVALDDAGSSAGATWWSADGSSWQFSQQSEVAYVHRAAAGRAQFLALGSTLDGQTLVGRSTDGRSWTWHAWPGSGSPADLVATADGWLAVGAIRVGGNDSVPIAWRSSDGIDWTCQMLPTAADAPFGHAHRVVAGALTTIVVGGVGAHCGGMAACAGVRAAWVVQADGSWLDVSSEPSALEVKFSTAEGFVAALAQACSSPTKVSDGGSSLRRRTTASSLQ